ncbi:MAG: hypothetical protein WBP79_11105 [Candidatus Acidiferrales bacterium]
MVRSIPVATAVMVLAALLSAATDKPPIYRNEEFGITLPVPDGALLCPNPDGEHDHGPVMVLNRFEAKGCNDAEGGRIIEVFASFNAMQATKTLNKLLQSQCIDIAKGKCQSAPPQMTLKGLPSMSARVNRTDGWIDIFVVTHAGKPDPAFDASVPSVNFVLWLHTRPEHMEKDLRVFRIVLETIRLSPAQ